MWLELATVSMISLILVVLMRRRKPALKDTPWSALTPKERATLIRLHDKAQRRKGIQNDQNDGS